MNNFEDTSFDIYEGITSMDETLEYMHIINQFIINHTVI